MEEGGRVPHRWFFGQLSRCFLVLVFLFLLVLYPWVLRGIRLGVLVVGWFLFVLACDVLFALCRRGVGEHVFSAGRGVLVVVLSGWRSGLTFWQRLPPTPPIISSTDIEVQHLLVVLTDSIVETTALDATDV